MMIIYQDTPMEKIRRVSSDCLKLLEEFECGGDFRTCMKAYRCPAGVWTIGMGTTRYPDGTPVKKGDVISEQKLYECLTYDIASAESAVALHVRPVIEQHQFDALVSLVYNIGRGNFMSSTLLRIINIDPFHPDVEKQFMRWIFANKKPLAGLIRRRRVEAHLYLYGKLNFNLTS